MNKFFPFLFILIFGLSYGQQPRIRFSYDSAGNQTKRVICIGCAAKQANEEDEEDEEDYKTLETITENDYLKEDEDILKQISYYPNPVLEELYVKWQNTAENQVINIDLFTMNGQQIKSINNLRDVELTTINFKDYADGYYNLVMTYSNGETKTLKIIKQ